MKNQGGSWVCELLGSASEQADIEIVNLLIAFLKAAKLPGFIIELGSVDLVVTLLSALGIAESQYPQFFAALAKKDREKLNTLAQRNAVAESQRHILPDLTTLYGDAAILPAANTLLADYADVLTEVKRLSQTMALLQQQHPEVDFHIDLSDVRGYGYHNGLIFSAYTDGIWQAIARGGRYDSFGNHFAEQTVLRPSTGFSCHLNLLLPLLDNVEQGGRVIACPFTAGDGINRLVDELRSQGDTVINVFEDNLKPLTGCTHRIEATADGYTVIAINKSF
ncbi:MAG: hypothetical protein CSA45_06645 [Gammaproteobacteria bacterium]|nr:MAG: hypothetical protein CSA45_06645 [Gammaproteobacteria bacterium]